MIIYYLVVKKDSILLLDIYSKNEKTDISKNELSLLVEIKRKEIG
jgi:hypothetical protein